MIVLPVSESNKVVLSKQSYGDTNKFVLTAGFMGEGESAEKACIRELKEELGLDTVKLKYIKSYGYKKSDTLMLGFVAFVKKSELSLSDEITKAEWKTFDEARLLLKDSFVAKKLLDDFFRI